MKPIPVLVVEDDALVAMDVARMVEACGCTVLGPVGRVDEGCAAAGAPGLAGAVLDIDLETGPVWPIAEALHRRGIPFVLATGYSYAEVPEYLWHVPLVPKPVTADTLGAALAQAGVIGG